MRLISAEDAIAVARALLGTPYGALDCISLIVRVIRTAPGGVPGYRTAGTNSLWKSFDNSAKYRDLMWRHEGIAGARAGMLAFKRSGSDIHHVGLVTGEGTVVHSSSARGCVVETALGDSWHLLAVHRYIGVAEGGETGAPYTARVTTHSGPLRIRAAAVTGRVIGHVPGGAYVRVLDEGADGWPRIDYDGRTGWVCGAYLTRAQD